MTSPVVIKRRADGKYLTHLVTGHARFGDQPRRIRSEGIATCMIRIDMGEDLGAFEILDAETVPPENRSAWRE